MKDSKCFFSLEIRYIFEKDRNINACVYYADFGRSDIVSNKNSAVYAYTEGIRKCVLSVLVNIV